MCFGQFWPPATGWLAHLVGTAMLVNGGLAAWWRSLDGFQTREGRCPDTRTFQKAVWRPDHRWCTWAQVTCHQEAPVKSGAGMEY